MHKVDRAGHCADQSRSSGEAGTNGWLNLLARPRTGEFRSCTAAEHAVLAPVRVVDSISDDALHCL